MPIARTKQLPMVESIITPDRLLVFSFLTDHFHLKCGAGTSIASIKVKKCGSDPPGFESRPINQVFEEDW
jgi:hypothetical protein